MNIYKKNKSMDSRQTNCLEVKRFGISLKNVITFILKILGRLDHLTSQWAFR